MKNYRFSQTILFALLLLLAACSQAPAPQALPSEASTLTTQAVSPGKVVAWGEDGLGRTDVPAGLSDVIAIAAGQTHSLALKSDGTVVGWGYTPFGSIPAGLSDVIAIAAGGFQGLALKSDGTVVGWGRNTDGQISIPAGLSDVIAIAAGGGHSLALKSDGTVVGWGSNFVGQTSIPAGLSDVIAIAAGDAHSLALKSDGTVVGWGFNTEGQTSIPAGLSGVIAISAGNLYSLALKSDGTVVGWGDNAEGQTSIPAGLSGVTAIAAGYADSLALKSDDTVVIWGRNLQGKQTIPAGLNNVIAIARGNDHIVAISTDTTAPSVTINQATGQADPTTSNPVQFTATFSEPAYGFTNSDVSLSGTANLTSASISVSGGPSVFSVSVNGLAGNGTVIAAIAANVANDLVGNPNTASTSTDNTVTVNFDSTPPAIAPSIIGTLGKNNWYTSNVNVSWTVTDAESAVSNQTGCDAATVSADTTGLTFTCSATSAGGTDSKSVTIKHDATAPAIAFESRTAANGAGWNNSNVTLEWSCTDTTSGVRTATVSQTVSSEGTNQSSTSTCEDNAGNSVSDTQTGINIDKTAPSLNPVVSPNPALLNASATVVSNASDNVSSLASESCASVDTSSVGSKSVSCSATDNAGNSASASATYQVIYNFAGFFSPVDNLPTLNQVKAGSAIPVKFSLSGNQGLSILASGSPSSQGIACDRSSTVDDIEQTVTAGSSSLSYNAATDTYSYVWKTQQSWANTCRQLIVTLVDGTQHKANFKFK